MQWITIATPPFTSIDKFDQVTEQTDAPEGMLARYVGTIDGELRVVVLWRTRQDADEFFGRTLGPALARALGPEPVGQAKVLGLDIVRSYVRDPVG